MDKASPEAPLEVCEEVPEQEPAPPLAKKLTWDAVPERKDGNEDGPQGCCSVLGPQRPKDSPGWKAVWAEAFRRHEVDTSDSIQSGHRPREKK